jgi:hypothetical protein
LQYFIDILCNLTVPKAHYSVAALFEVGRTFIVIWDLLNVLPAVQFDNQFPFRAAQVRDIALRRKLPTELESRESSPSQAAPQLCLERCLFVAEVTRADAEAASAAIDPHPAPRRCASHVDLSLIRERCLRVCFLMTFDLSDRSRSRLVSQSDNNEFLFYWIDLFLAVRAEFHSGHFSSAPYV